MATTNYQQNPMSNRLVCPSLVSMEKKGFDHHCLARLQGMAFRHAAQTIQHRVARGETCNTGDLKVLVNQYLAGKHYTGDCHTVTPSHIATYMHSKSQSDKAAPSQLVREAEALATIELPVEIYGREPGMMITAWLARHLVALNRYADRADSATPIFARTLREHVAHIQTIYSDLPNLKMAIRMVQENQNQGEGFGEDDRDSDSENRPH